MPGHSVIYDTDKDTIVATEWNSDEDLIRIFNGNDEQFNIDTNRIVSIDEQFQITTTRTTDGSGFKVNIHGGDAVTAGAGGVVQLYGGNQLDGNAEGYIHVGGGGDAPSHTMSVGSIFTEGQTEINGLLYADGGISAVDESNHSGNWIYQQLGSDATPVTANNQIVEQTFLYTTGNYNAGYLSAIVSKGLAAGETVYGYTAEIMHDDTDAATAQSVAYGASVRDTDVTSATQIAFLASATDNGRHDYTLTTYEQPMVIQPLPSDTGRNVTILGSDATTGDHDGGKLYLGGGNKTGTGVDGWVQVGRTGTPDITVDDNDLYVNGNQVNDGRMWVGGDDDPNTRFAGARAVFTQIDSQQTFTEQIGLVGENRVDSTDGIGVLGVSKTPTEHNVTGVWGEAVATDTATGMATGVKAASTSVHVGGGLGINVGVYADVANAAWNYSFYGLRGDLFNADTGHFGITSFTSGDFDNTQLVVSKANTGATNIANNGIVAETKSIDATAPGNAVLGIAYVDGNQNANAISGLAGVSASADTGISIGILSAAVATHSGGSNVGVYSGAANGNSNYSFFGLSGELYNSGAMLIGLDITGSWANTKAEIYHSDTGATRNYDIGLVGEAATSGSNNAHGLFGAGKGNDTYSGIGVGGTGVPSLSTDSASSVGISGEALNTHSGGWNIGVTGYAEQGSRNYAFYANKGDTVAERQIYKLGTTQLLENDESVDPVRSFIKIGGDGGAAVLDTDPAIQDGQEDGQILILEGTNDVNTVTIDDGSNTAMAGDMTLGNRDTISYIWDNSSGLWVETARSNN
jgi:hypothetical protein